MNIVEFLLTKTVDKALMNEFNAGQYILSDRICVSRIIPAGVAGNI